MIWFILLGAALVIAVLYNAYHEVRNEIKDPSREYSTWGNGPVKPWYKRYGSIFGIYVAALAFGTTFVVLIGMMLNMLTYIFVDEDYSYSRPLTTINDNSSVSGSFFLGSGSIKEIPTFMYYVLNERGEFRLQHVDADDAFITYTDGPPEVIVHTTRTKSEWLAVEMDMAEYEYEFRVPRGSVKQVYTLDAK